MIKPKTYCDISKADQIVKQKDIPKIMTSLTAWLPGTGRLSPGVILQQLGPVRNPYSEQEQTLPVAIAVKSTRIALDVQLFEDSLDN